MGNNCNSKCNVCMFMCLIFPIGTCQQCRRNNNQASLGDSEESDKFTIDDILKYYDNMAALHQPAEFCDKLDGTFHSEPTPTCVIDLSHSDNFLKEVVDIDTPEQLCSQVDGNFADGICTLNLALCGKAALDVQQVACSSLGGTWGANNCALLM